MSTSYPVDPQILIATLQRSRIPVILVEGPEDVEIIRKLKDQLGLGIVDVQQCGGRSKLIEVFRNRNRFPQIKFLFVADLDLWSLEGIPVVCKGIEFSHGYSIENDLLTNSKLFDLLTTAENGQLTAIIDLLSQWFAFEIETREQGYPLSLNIKIRKIIDLSAMSFTPLLTARWNGKTPSQTKVTHIKKHCMLLIRGKQLLEAFVSFSARPGRNQQHGRSNLIDLAVKNNLSPLLIHYKEAIKNAFN